ncbi:glycosyltransferase family 39 protein [Melittangium boletus]|uniref:Glycosyltransferase RgtA/B/C/D-like domain-containing protein n=1 Tax=Melittangium boletus DSM 14713 TaxID=1294270 RepID=A0A250I9M1_9BACT|nr:glycosyltransferase family 39 protein [Melittangium boletus]ATB28445.1 hypothetical protein MEBOL_001892 [Melittangium boletus DSM 14713]
MHDILALVGFALAHYAFLLILTLVAWLLGCIFLQRRWYTSGWEHTSHAATLGLGMLTHGLFVLGSVGLLYRSAVLGGVALALGLGVKRWWPCVLEGVATLRGMKPLPVLGGLLVLGFCVPLLLTPLIPPTSWDATEYYLRCAWLFVDQHRIVLTPTLRMAVYPHLNTMLFTLGLLFADDLAAQLTQLLALLLTGAALMGAGSRLFSARAGVWAAALTIGSPIAIWLGSVAYIDMGLTLFLTVATLTVLRWFEQGDRHWLFLSAAFFGFAASAKHNAFPLFALVGVVVLYEAFRRRQVGHAILFGLLGLAVAAPWYVRNAYYTGNPFFPLLPQVFGYSYLNAGDMERFNLDLNLSRRHELKALLQLPWQLTFEPHKARAEAPLSPGYLAALPFLLVGAWKNRWVRILLALVGVQLVIWLASTQLIRHLMPTLPLLSLAVGGALHQVLPWRMEASPRLPRAVLAIGLALLLLVPARNFARRMLRQTGGLPVTTEQREQFLLRSLPTYASYKLLNETRGRDYTVYALLDENMAYFAQGTFLGDHFGPVRYDDLLKSAGNGELLYAALRGFGADHFLVNRTRNTHNLPNDDFFNSHFKLLHVQQDHLLYALSDRPLSLDSGPNLVSNPGFDMLDKGQPVGWSRAGSPELVSTAEGQYVAKGLGESNVFHQEIPVHGGRQYQLSFRARGVGEEPRKARLQVNWITDSRHFLPPDMEIVVVGPEWKSYTMRMLSPAEATRGSIPATPQGDHEVLFDDFRLVELTER